MNKKEISEIKKQFTPENCSLTRICGCYVDGEKNKKTELKEASGISFNVMALYQKKKCSNTLKFSANPFPEQQEKI